MTNKTSAFGCLVAFTILGFAGYGMFEAFNQLTHRQTPEPELSASRFLGTQVIVPLPANPRKLAATLKTSWITGDQKSGIMRYTVDISLKQSTDAFTDSIFLQRISACSISIDLEDKNGFKLTQFPLKIARVVDDDQNVTMLASNDFIPMSRETYQSVTSTWSPTWNCF